jgi:hypothetical protein
LIDRTTDDHSRLGNRVGKHPQHHQKENERKLIRVHACDSSVFKEGYMGLQKSKHFLNTNYEQSPSKKN